MPSVLIVVLNWNGINDTEKCLASLLRQSYANFTIAIVDNGSVDDSLQRLRTLEEKHRDKLIVIANEKNEGFAGGVNTGIRYAIDHSYDLVALFNNDAVADKDWLKHLVKAIEPKMVGIATGLLLHADGKTIDSTGDWYSTWGLAYPRGRGHKTETAAEGSEVFGASGGASLYKTVVFKKIGLFDEDFFVYFEDVDISFRARLAGWRVMYEPKAIAYHKQGASSKKVPGLALQKTFANLPQVFVKNVPRGLLWHIGSRFYLSYLLFFGNAVIRGQGRQALKGIGRSIALTPSSLAKRRKIQKQRKVSAAELKKMLWNDLPPDQTGMRKFRKLFTGKS
jgi:GT2 family glycosyltransferase